MGSDKNGVHRDSSGRTLADYPRPSVAVDTALLTLTHGSDTLSVLQVKRSGEPGWALPGTFLHEGERLMDAVLRALRQKAGVQGLRPRQLHVFDDPARDNRGWVLSVAHVMVVPEAMLMTRSPDTRLMPVTAPGRMPYGHGDIIEMAVANSRRRYEEVSGRSPARLVHRAAATRGPHRDCRPGAAEGHLPARDGPAPGRNR